MYFKRVQGGKDASNKYTLSHSNFAQVQGVEIWGDETVQVVRRVIEEWKQRRLCAWLELDSIQILRKLKALKDESTRQYK